MYRIEHVLDFLHHQQVVFGHTRLIRQCCTIDAMTKEDGLWQFLAADLKHITINIKTVQKYITETRI